jgi:hypothetical protein
LRQPLARLVKSWGLAGLLLLVALAWSAPLLAMEPPGPDAEALWRYINQEPNFRSWGKWPEFPDLRRSVSPHGFYVRIFTNEVAMKSKGRSLPPGSILVREGFAMDYQTYAPTSEVMAYTVMYKIKGYNPQAGDWFWALYSKDGRMVEAGKLDQCIQCHSTEEDNDFVEDHKVK